MYLIAIEPSSVGLMLPPGPFCARSESARCLRPRVATDDGVFAERWSANTPAGPIAPAVPTSPVLPQTRHCEPP
jgi:hypothetical protein